MEVYYMYPFNISNISVDFKLKIFDVFSFGSVKIDQISVLKLNLRDHITYKNWTCNTFNQSQKAVFGNWIYL